MAHVQVHRDDVALDEPTLVEGLPGVGFVGKLAADHLIEQYGMVHYASLYCEGVPQVAVYQDGDSTVRPPVRLYADPERDLLVLRSDVPVSPTNAEEFAECVTEWLVDNDATPVYLSGLPTEERDVPGLSGIATDAAKGLLEDAGIDAPSQDGAITGPTGALLHEAERRDLGAVGLVVEADAQFPDPEAARVLLDDGIAPLVGIDVETEVLVEHAEEIADAKSQLAQQMQQGTDESTSARPMGMYQ